MLVSYPLDLGVCLVWKSNSLVGTETQMFTCMHELAINARLHGAREREMLVFIKL